MVGETMAKRRPISDDYPTTFRLTLEERVRAASGLPAHLRRRRRIEDMEAALEGVACELLEAAEQEHGAGTTAAERAFEEAVRDLDLRAFNDLVRRHNEYFPIEANLPIAFATGAPTYAGKRWEPLKELTPAELTERVRRARRGESA